MRHFTDALFEDLLQGLEDLELYFLSPDNMNGKILSPRVPHNFLIKNGYEDGETPRVCFAKSIDGALMALSQNLKGKELFVHQPVDPDFHNIVEPSLEQVPDVELTTEVWYTDDIEVKTIGKILVEEDDGLPGHKYTYGDNEAELYGWKWKWLDADTENLKESASFEELNINSPEELLDWMEENITYELANDEYGAEDDPPTKTAEEVLATGTGHCAEQSYLEKKVLDELGYNTQLIFVKENNSKDDYGADGSAHLFLTYIDEDDKHCWFEHSMQHSKGIHKYDNLEALLQGVADQWWRYDENSDTLEARFIPEPITGIDNWGLAQKCHEYPVEATFDISNNIIESEVPQEFDPPYNAEQIKKEYGEDTYNKLKDDPAHSWRMETGLELIHKEPEAAELRRIWANWLLMTPEQKAESDKKSIELFGKTNAENFAELIKTYN